VPALSVWTGLVDHLSHLTLTAAEYLCTVSVSVVYVTLRLSMDE